ncbi:MAG: NAD(P)/FAD-dependent oxidoreductase [Thermoplasmatales archaeon]|nr:MAG: NAD(P)/FAD-dependent oxidoreductase [Thermoplasmatales archaeon]
MKYEVVIVGAGPAGSTAAKFLSEKGIKVLLLDKDKFPRGKPCGGGLPVRLFKKFPYINDDFIESYSQSACAYSPTLKYKLELQRDEHILAMILREKFDYELVKLAINSGAKLIDGETAVDVKITNNSAKILLDDNTNVESEIVIGADGVWSTIAKKTGLCNNYKNICMCAFEEYKISPETLDRYLGKARTCHLHFKLNQNAGYGWVFPKKEHINIGISEFRQAIDQQKGKKNIKEKYIEYVKILKKDNVIPENLKIGRIRGAALPTRPLDKTYSERVIVCGDAAGFSNPVSGEGIFHAMQSGKIAADVITKALEKNDTSEEFLSKYQKNWYKDFGKDLKLLYRTSMIWGEGYEKFIEIIFNDKKLGELVVDTIIGKIEARKCRRMMIRRLAYLKIKDKFVKNPNKNQSN